jgi:CBS domain-containing protein
MFPVPPHHAFIIGEAVLGCVVAGIGAGLLSIVMTQAVYAAEDAFHRLPIHWMWWPALGGIAIGVGGMLFPQALGVGYDTIGALLQGDVPRKVFAGVLLVKSSIWAISLGSGTSGGVLAPLFMMGGALGGVEGSFLPHVAPGFWPLVSMGAVLAGTMSAPLTGIVFAVEVTHDLNMVLPVMITVTVAYAMSVLTLRRSILTEKIARRGYHLTREYDVDPLEILFVREVVRTNVVALPAAATAAEVRALIATGRERRGQRLYPLVDSAQRLTGLVTRGGLEQWLRDAPQAAHVSEVARRNPVIAYTDERLKSIVQRMAETGLTRFPVVERGRERHLVGMISLADLLKARKQNLEAEQRRERVLSLRIAFPRRLAAMGSPARQHHQAPEPETQEVE